mgnify:CR=1 FL=1
MRELTRADNWQQIRKHVKQKWAEFSKSDLDKVDGDNDKLTAKLQEKYGYSRERARQEIDKLLNNLK